MASKNFIIVIPARLNSSRLPQKMLQLIGNKPLIEWTWQEALKAQAKQTIIATDDEQIFAHMSSAGAQVVMTAPDHPSGTDRLSEVARKQNFDDEDIIVNWQGDEPFLPARFIEKVVKQLAESDCAMSTLATPLNSWKAFTDPNHVKVVLNHMNEALYFSRAPIPFPRDEAISTQDTLSEGIPVLHHLGLYAYRAFFLKQYPTLKPSVLETIERLEQLRALTNGYKISVVISKEIPPLGIDTAADLEKARQWVIQNHLI